MNDLLSNPLLWVGVIGVGLVLLVLVFGGVAMLWLTKPKGDDLYIRSYKRMQTEVEHDSLIQQRAIEARAKLRRRLIEARDVVAEIDREFGSVIGPASAPAPEAPKAPAAGSSPAA